ncbi:hypothetical protein Bca52824_027389 [Brassica carinata]|uniref:HSF-type DNA-binding domain-containing protein n=1 Tax=Brassica carinata TaxID=52824 RepID=A0A8X7VAG8_BRACI|nr:hypothetical protein Bca52824_027389 [Brassica carinata]
MVRKLPTSSFNLQLYQVVDDRSSDPIISWSKSNNNSFGCLGLESFASDILMKSPRFGQKLNRV